GPASRGVRAASLRDWYDSALGICDRESQTNLRGASRRPLHVGGDRYLSASSTGTRRTDHRRAYIDQGTAASIAPYHRRSVRPREGLVWTGPEKTQLGHVGTSGYAPLYVLHLKSSSDSRTSIRASQAYLGKSTWPLRPRPRTSYGRKSPR